MIKSGLVSVTFRDLSPEKLIDLVAQAGLDAIEWGGDIHVPPGDWARAKEIRTLTLARNLNIAAYGSYYRAGLSEAEGVKFDAVLESASALGAPTIRVWTGKLSSSQADHDYRCRVADDLHRIAEKAAVHSIGISCEFHDGTLSDTAESTLALLNQADHANLRTYWQPRHGKTTESGLSELEVLASRLNDIHVFHWWPSPQERHLLADGTERWLQFISRIRTIPGDRHVLIEFVRDNLPENFLRDAETLKNWLSTFSVLGFP